jgi:hypothetical protein
MARSQSPKSVVTSGSASTRSASETESTARETPGLRSQFEIGGGFTRSRFLRQAGAKSIGTAPPMRRPGHSHSERHTTRGPFCGTPS